MRSEDEIEYRDKRRSSRIIALEEKKRQERERELELESQRKDNSINHDTRNKGKGKATMEEHGDLCDNINEDEERSTKKRRKSKEFYQLISSIKELERQSTSRTNESSLNGIPLKNTLEIIIDFLQRKDPDELFAEPINPDVVHNYYEIVKQPMDFATMRAKLHEGIYTELEQFKRDIFLICSNATSVHSERSKYHEVAEDISRYSKWTFEALNVDSQHLNPEFSQSKKRQNRKAQKGQQGTPKRVAPKQSGSTNSPETQKRDLYFPPSMPLSFDVLDASKKANIQLNESTTNYKESLLRFVKGLGPVAEKVAAKKLAALQEQQLNTSENVSGTQSMHQPTPIAPTNPVSFNAQTRPLPFPLLHNRPLTIPGSAAQQNRTVNTNNVGRVGMGDRPHQRNKIVTNENWQACAAALLSNIFFQKGEEGSSNANETMDARTLAKGKMVAPVDNVSSLHKPVQENYNRHRLGVNNSSSSNNTMQWNTSTNMPNMFSAGSSRYLPPIVHPTLVISGPQLRPMRSTSLSSGNTPSGLPMMQQPGIQNTVTLPTNNLPLYQSMQENPTSCTSSKNITQTSNLPLYQSMQENPTSCTSSKNFTQTSNLPLYRSMQENPTSCTSSKNITQTSHVHQLWPDDMINLADLRLKPQPEARDSMYGRPSNNPAEVSLMQEPHQPWPANSMSSLNTSMLSSLYQPMQGESVPCNNLSTGSTAFPSLDANFSNDSYNSLYDLGTLHQPMGFQAMMDPENFIDDIWPMDASYEEVMHQAATFTPPSTQGFPDMQMQALNEMNAQVPAPPQQQNSAPPPHMALGGGINFCGGGNATTGQPEEAPPQLSWYQDQLPNLDLEL
ncbi:hypothetical protein DEO72_LG1g1564 [Vigna unguiculata]|uniref:Bromo domain-containing protein n=1 Tax=Vigna unguiculata TaxID=3917 RepID=A0A4D6KJ34_VIGUN|nr:hypothetical protein DEO72_LG1g1564 [Vigna unguiculata]